MTKINPEKYDGVINLSNTPKDYAVGSPEWVSLPSGTKVPEGTEFTTYNQLTGEFRHYPEGVNFNYLIPNGFSCRANMVEDRGSKWRRYMFLTDLTIRAHDGNTRKVIRAMRAEGSYDGWDGILPGGNSIVFMGEDILSAKWGVDNAGNGLLTTN